MNSDDSETTKIETLGIPKGWRWMTGMWTVEGWTVLAPGTENCQMTAPLRCERFQSTRSLVPDWTHPGTLGCALALARDLWGDPGLCVEWGPRYWSCVPQAVWAEKTPMHGVLKNSLRNHGTEGEALFAAIEAAPEQAETPKERTLDELREDVERCKDVLISMLGDGATSTILEIVGLEVALARLEGAEMQRDRASAALAIRKYTGRVNLSGASPQEAVRRVYTAGLETLSASERPDLRGFQMETANLPEHITTTVGGFTEWRSHWVRRPLYIFGGSDDSTTNPVYPTARLELTVKLRRLDGGLEHVIESVTLEECEP